MGGSLYALLDSLCTPYLSCNVPKCVRGLRKLGDNFASHSLAGAQAIAEPAQFSAMPETGLDPVVLES